MLPIRLRDIALLSCAFKERFIDEDDQAEGEGNSRSESDEYPSEQLLQLAITVDAEDGEVVCFIEGKLDDERLPFELSFEMAFLYEVTGEQPLPSKDDLQPTLVWLAFPHLREFVAEITGRSPASQYFLPPLTRLPYPDDQAPSPQGKKDAGAESAE
jgi:hypothetical protein